MTPAHTAPGMLLGKHRLAPVLSPKKSIEGAVGGVVGSALLGCIYAYFFGAKMDEVSNPMVACAVACAIAAVISQIGDLAASAIKRNHNGQGLRKPDSGTRRRAGSVRQHDFYGTGDLFCTDVFTIKRKHV